MHSNYGKSMQTRAYIGACCKQSNPPPAAQRTSKNRLLPVSSKIALTMRPGCTRARNRHSHTHDLTYPKKPCATHASFLPLPAHLGLSSLEANRVDEPSTGLLALCGRLRGLTLEDIRSDVRVAVGGIAYTVSRARIAARDGPGRRIHTIPPAE